MPLQEITTQEDLILYEITRNPVWLGEFFYNFDKLEFEEPFEFTWYQKEMLLDFNTYVSLACARAVGKTVTLSVLILWILINNIFPGDYIIYTTPGKAHLEPVFTTLVRLLRTNTFLKQFIAPHSGVNNSDFTIELLNKAKLMCRIAGQTGTGVSVIGLHTPFEMLDESGYYPFGTWIELQPTFNTWTPGCRQIVSGVPTGIRENNVCFHCDQENSNFSKHRISAYQNPRFTEEDEQRAVEQYGGKESDDFIHLILGQHGRPVFALFDRELMELVSYPVYKLLLDGLKLYDNLAGYIEKLSILPSVPNKKFDVFLGVDLGYTEPTAIFVLYIDDNGRIKFNAKIEMRKVSYPIQERVIDYLDSKYDPIFIGMDIGSSGKAVYQHFVEDAQYNHKDYHKRLVAVDFSTSIVLGIDSEGKEIKSKTKPFATSLLQEYSNNHKIVYTTTDLETVIELERMTYTRTMGGEIVYRTLTERGGKKGEDHFTSALLCATMAYFVQFESLTKRVHIQLMQPKHFIG